MKIYVRQALLKITFVALFLMLLYYPAQKQIQNLTQRLNKKQISTIQTRKKKFPVRLVIPAINVNADVQQLGVTQTGEMEVPNNAFDVGWFSLGPQPGEKGSAVIAGHFDGKNGEAGVFVNLNKLKEGDKLYIKDDKGISTVFIVREKHIYDPGHTNNVFISENGVHLNLITCDGLWDGVKKNYTKRLVVFSDITLKN